MFWIINDSIKFSPDTSKLTSISKSDLIVTLTTPASRCLVLLLESAPNVVSQKQLFEFVWAEDGMLVPTNTLYQNISIIRRGLRTAGETEDQIIITVPRKGFQIDSHVKVYKTEEQFISNEMTEKMNHQENHITNECNINNTVTNTIERVKTHNLLPFALMIMSLIVGFFFFQIVTPPDSSKNFFKDYNINKVESGCHFHSKNFDIKKLGNFTKYKDIILKTGLDCNKYPWIYFPSSSFTPALSAIACQKPYEKALNSNCVTIYFYRSNL